MKKYSIFELTGKVYYSKKNWEEDIFKAKTYETYESAEKDISGLPPGLYEIKTIYMKL